MRPCGAKHAVVKCRPNWKPNLSVQPSAKMQQVNGRLPKLLAALLLLVQGLAAGFCHDHCGIKHQAEYAARTNIQSHGPHCGHADNSSFEESCPIRPSQAPDYDEENCPACRLLAEHVLPFSIASPDAVDGFSEAAVHFEHLQDNVARRYCYLSRAPPVV